MADRVYKLEVGSIQWKFQKSRNKVQIFGGGFGNGKTTALVIKVLEVARDYPGANILVARATYPKLVDTIQKELLKWCPKSWIAPNGFTKGPPGDLVLKNGSEIHFRYISQKSSSGQSGTSNLLSATYDLVVVDQMEDPEIVEKDFDDILGRLRGNTPYTGVDPTMPRSGPRWFLIALNPTRNWVYSKLVKPLHDYAATGERSENLLVDVDTGEPLIDLFEGSTYTNAANLDRDYIKTLEAAYKGQMRDRYLLGQWAAYEGLVYPEYDPLLHKVRATDIRRLFRRLSSLGYRPTPITGYDYGISVPSCFLLGFADDRQNVFFVDGFYKPEQTIGWQAKEITRIMEEWGFDAAYETVYADPQIFRRGAGDKQTVGKTVAAMFQDVGITMVRGNNDILNGIQKIKSYLYPSEVHRNALTGTTPGAHMYFSDALPWLETEISNYYWKRDVQDDIQDKPQDKNDHAMDTLKYALSNEIDIAEFRGDPSEPPSYLRWGEYEGPNKSVKKARYAN
jgi:hypothetical protein